MSFTMPIVFGILCCIIAGILCSRLSDTTRLTILSALALFFVCSEIAKQILLYQQNQRYIWWYFPFQLCSLHLYLLPIVVVLRIMQQCRLRSNRHSNKYSARSAFSPSDRKKVFRSSSASRSFNIYDEPQFGQKLHLLLCTFLADYGTLAGIVTFADTTGMQYSLPILTVHSYLWHFLMIFTGVMLGLESENHTACSIDTFTTSPDSFYQHIFSRTCDLFLIFAAIAEMFNYMFHQFGEINMFYISLWEPITQVVFRDIAAVTGDLICHVLYLWMIMAGAWVMHSIFAKFRSKSNVLGTC